MPEKRGDDVVGFEYKGIKYCRKCFHLTAPQGVTIAYGIILRAVVQLSEFKKCEFCGVFLTDEDA